MTTASNARKSARSPRARARIEIETKGNGNGNGNGANKVTWTKVTSLAFVGELGLSQGRGAVSQAKFAVHLCQMGSMGILSGAEKSDDAKHHWKEFQQRRNEGAAGFEKPGDANKASQFKNFLKLGELGGKVNGEGLLARVQVALDKARGKSIPFGAPRPKQTFVAYLECAKAQIKKGNGAELTDGEIVSNIMSAAGEKKSQREMVADAIAEITAAAKMGGAAKKSLAELASNIQALLPKLSNEKPE